MRKQKNTKEGPDSQGLYVGGSTRRDLRYYTSEVQAAAVDIYISVFRVLDSCLCALRAVDIMDENDGCATPSLLTEFNDAISASTIALSGASRLLSDLRTSTRKLASVVYELTDHPGRLTNEQ